MASDNRKTKGNVNNIVDLPSKKPGKLVSAKRASTGKLNLHLVSSTPMNPAKRAKFFDESNQYRSPIKSSGSSTDLKTNSAGNQIKVVQKEQNTKQTMNNNNNKEQSEDSSPFPYYANLDVKKMTICASDDDDEENDDFMFGGSKAKKKNKVTLDTDNESSDDPDLVTNPNETVQAVVENVEKFTSDIETSDAVENNLTKMAKKNVVDANATKIVTKSTTKAIKSGYEYKENVTTDTDQIITKPKSQTTEKNIINKETDITEDESKLDVSSKQKKSNENTVKKKKNTKNKNDSEKAKNKNNAKTKTAEKSVKIPESEGSRKSSRSRPSTVPYWMASLNTNTYTHRIDSDSDEVLTKSDKIANTIVSVKETKRPRTVPETVTKRPKVNKTVTLNNSKIKLKPQPVTVNKSKLKSNQAKSNNKIEAIKEIAENITMTRSKIKLKSAPKKSNTKKEAIEENADNMSLKSKNTLKSKENEKNTSFIDEIVKKRNESNSNVLKTNEIANDTQIKTANHSKEILDKEHKVKKNKVEDIAEQLKIASSMRFKSPSKYTLRDSSHQSVLKNEIFQTPAEDIDDGDDELDTIVTESFVKNKNNCASEDIHALFKETFEVLGPASNSHRVIDRNKNQKETNKIEYTPGVALKQNKKVTKSTVEKKVPNTEKRSKTSSTKQSNTNLNESEESSTETKEVPSNYDNMPQRRTRKPQVTGVEKSVRKGNKPEFKNPGLAPKRVAKNLRQCNKSSKQVNFNLNDSEVDNTIQTDSLSSYENPSKVSREAAYNYKRNPPNQFDRPSRDSRYPRRTLFYERDNIDRRRKNRYVENDSTIDDSDSWSSEEVYVPKKKKRKYTTRSDYKNCQIVPAPPSGFINFKQKALAEQVPVATQIFTQIELEGETLMMECFGKFPSKMSKPSERSTLSGTCFSNEFFVAGTMEIKLGTVKKCNASNNHTYFVILDGVAEISIAGTTKILRIGDCCIVPKNTFYYIANASSEVNLLVNVLKISL